MVCLLINPKPMFLGVQMLLGWHPPKFQVQLPFHLGLWYPLLQIFFLWLLIILRVYCSLPLLSPFSASPSVNMPLIHIIAHLECYLLSFLPTRKDVSLLSIHKTYFLHFSYVFMSPPHCHYVPTEFLIFEADCEFLIFADQILKNIVKLNSVCEKKELWHEKKVEERVRVLEPIFPPVCGKALQIT